MFFIPLFGLFATAGIIFLLAKGGGDNPTRLGRKNTLDKGEEDFYGSHAAAAGIGRIGTAGLPLRKNAIPHRSHSANGRNGS